MNLNIKLRQTKRHGFEVFEIYVNGLKKHCYFSYRHARTKYLQIKQAAEQSGVSA